MTSRKRYRAWKAFKRIQGRVLDARGRRTFPGLASPKFPFLYLSNAWDWRNSKRLGTLSARLFAKKVCKHVKPEYVRWRCNCIWGRWATSSPGHFSLALEVGRPTSKAREKRPGDEVGRWGAQTLIWDANSKSFISLFIFFYYSFFLIILLIFNIET